MQNLFKSCSLIIIAVGMILSSASCQIAPLTGAPVDPQGLKNGVYEGEYRKGFNKVVVKVTIAEGRITDVALVKHTASWIGRKTDKIIPQRILAQQSTKVDAISGATNSSRVIMNAVQKAIEKAYQ
ncbi:MAG: FMN-binding protein [Thermodesulfobacteriota bacterium]|nr:FMN-binding protein [Thermodesulfobacteriota bacterium]